MSAQTNHLKEKFEKGFEKAKSENSLEDGRVWIDDTVEISNEVLAKFIAKVSDRQEKIIAEIEEFEEGHNFNLPLADCEIL